jgi:hypothetical protein
VLSVPYRILPTSHVQYLTGRKQAFPSRHPLLLSIYTPNASLCTSSRTLHQQNFGSIPFSPVSSRNLLYRIPLYTISRTQHQNVFHHQHRRAQAREHRHQDRAWRRPQQRAEDSCRLGARPVRRQTISRQAAAMEGRRSLLRPHHRSQGQKGV